MVVHSLLPPFLHIHYVMSWPCRYCSDVAIVVATLVGGWGYWGQIQTSFLFGMCLGSSLAFSPRSRKCWMCWGKMLPVFSAGGSGFAPICFASWPQNVRYPGFGFLIFCRTAYRIETSLDFPWNFYQFRRAALLGFRSSFSV